MKNEDEIGIARALDEATLRLMPNNDIAYSPVTRIIREKKNIELKRKRWERKGKPRGSTLILVTTQSTFWFLLNTGIVILNALI